MIPQLTKDAVQCILKFVPIETFLKLRHVSRTWNKAAINCNDQWAKILVKKGPKAIGPNSKHRCVGRTCSNCKRLRHHTDLIQKYDANQVGAYNIAMIYFGKKAQKRSSSKKTTFFKNNERLISSWNEITKRVEDDTKCLERFSKKRKIDNKKINLFFRLMAFYHDFGSYWSSLPIRQKRIAEEAALLNYDNPELLKFAKHRSDCLNRKKTLRQEYGYPYARMSLETGIILTEDQLEHFSQSEDLLYPFLFNHPKYQEYVVQCAQRILLTDSAPEKLAVSALKIFHKVMRLKQSSRCPDLLKVLNISYFSNSDKMNLRLVCRSTSNLLKNYMLMRINIMDQTILLPLSFTTEDLRRFLNLPNATFVRYGKSGPIFPEGLLVQIRKADIFIKF
jgi:hypothetical protein